MQSRTSTILEMEETIVRLSQSIESAIQKESQLKEDIKLLEAQKADVLGELETQKKQKSSELLDITKQIKSANRELSNVQKNVQVIKDELKLVEENLFQEESKAKEIYEKANQKEQEVIGREREAQLLFEEARKKIQEVKDNEDIIEESKKYYDNLIKSAEEKESKASMSMQVSVEGEKELIKRENAVANLEIVAKNAEEQAQKELAGAAKTAREIIAGADAKLINAGEVRDEALEIKELAQQELELAKEESQKATRTRKQNEDMANLLEERRIDLDQRENKIRLLEKKMSIKE